MNMSLESLPDEILEEIAKYGPSIYNKLVRAIPKLGRISLKPSEQNLWKRRFLKRIVDDRGGIRWELGGKLHSLNPEQPSYECVRGCKWWHSHGKARKIMCKKGCVWENLDDGWKLTSYKNDQCGLVCVCVYGVGWCGRCVCVEGVRFQ